MQATKPSDREIFLTETFAAPRQTVFDALTQPTHLVQWLKPTNMSLITCDVDLRPGGSFRYVFQRPRGAKIQVRGTYQIVDPPSSFAYQETYEFSPLKVSVNTNLDQAGAKTVFRQNLTYSSQQERDDDFEGVAMSAAEVYANLARYLESQQ